MKKLLLTLGISLVINIVWAQNYQTKVLENDPELVYDKYVTLDLLGSDFDFDFLSSNIYLGTNVFWPVNDKFTIDGNLKIPFFNFKGSGFGLTFEPGLFYSFSSKEKMDEVPVVISGEMYADYNYNTGERTDIVNYLSANGTYKNTFGARAGLYFRQGPFVGPNESSIDVESSHTIAGLYMGFQRVSQTFLKLLVNGNGLNDAEFIGAGFSKLYGDVMFLPVKNIADQELMDANEKTSPFGFRLGMQWNKHPYKTGRFLNRIVYGGEIGTRPLTGFYVTVQLGWVVFERN